jgi:hypothetical protein
MRDLRTNKISFIITSTSLGIPMNITKKSALVILTGLILSGGYFFLEYETPSNTKNPTTLSGESQSGIENDTLKRLKTQSESGTVWGMSPFGSGKPLEEIVAKEKPDFQKPNTEWKTRTIQLKDGRWMTYEFGKGNPSGVALDQEGLEKLRKECEDPKSREFLDISGVCNPESDRPYYVSSQVEYYLMSALSNRDWENLYYLCDDAIRFGDTASRSHSPDPYLLFDQVFGSGLLDVNRFITIDLETGRKTLDIALTKQLIDFLEGSKAMIGRGESLINPYGNCVDKYSQGIVNDLEAVLNHYRIPQ